MWRGELRGLVPQRRGFPCSKQSQQHRELQATTGQSPCAGYRHCVMNRRHVSHGASVVSLALTLALTLALLHAGLGAGKSVAHDKSSSQKTGAGTAHAQTMDLRIPPLLVVAASIPVFAAAGMFALTMLATHLLSSRPSANANTGTSSTAPFKATPAEARRAMIRVAELDADDLVLDLGCGDARLLIEAARASGCECTGYESAPAVYWLARFRVLLARLPTPWGLGKGSVTVQREDFWTQKLDPDTTVVFLFLLPIMLRDVAPKLKRELLPGTRIVTFRWGFPDWQFRRREYVRTADSHGKGSVLESVYMYVLEVELKDSNCSSSSSSS